MVLTVWNKGVDSQNIYRRYYEVGLWGDYLLVSRGTYHSTPGPENTSGGRVRGVVSDKKKKKMINQNNLGVPKDYTVVIQTKSKRTPNNFGVYAHPPSLSRETKESLFMTVVDVCVPRIISVTFRAQIKPPVLTVLTLSTSISGRQNLPMMYSTYQVKEEDWTNILKE